MTQEQLQKWFESCLKYYLDNIQEPKVEDKIKTKYEFIFFYFLNGIGQ